MSLMDLMKTIHNAGDRPSLGAGNREVLSQEV